MFRRVAPAVGVFVLITAVGLVAVCGPASVPKWRRSLAGTRSNPAPKVVVEGGLTHELGTMTQGATGKWSWVVRNVGEGDLDLWKGTSTYNAKLAIFKDGEKAVVKPGESTEIEMQWQIRHVIGPFRKGFYLETNDPVLPSLPLFVHAEVKPLIAVIPGETVELRSIDGDHPNEARLTLYSPDRPETKITKFTTSKPGFLVAEAMPMTGEGRKEWKIKAGQRVHIHLKPGFPIGPIREEVVIQTDHPLRPEIKINVIGSVAGPISILPKRIRMVTVKTSEGATGEVVLTIDGGRTANFEVVHKPNKLGVAIEPADGEGRYRVTVDVPKGTAPGFIDGEIIIKTDFPDAGELKIPVSILVGVG